MVANYAGVMTQNDSRNDIIIRGNSPSGVMWRMEGVEIANPNHFAANGTTGGPVSMINNNLLANSDFLTGAFPAEYGNALAGAFDLRLRSGNRHKQEFTGQVGFNGFEAGAEGPLLKTSKGNNPSYLINYRFSTLDLIDKMGFDVGTGSAVPKYQDMTYMIDVPGVKYGRFKLFGLWGNSNISLGRNLNDLDGNSYSSRGTAIDYRSNLLMNGASHTLFLNEQNKIQSTISVQGIGSEVIVDSIKQVSKLIMPYYRGLTNERKYSASIRYTGKIDSRQNLAFGVVVDYFEIEFADSVRRYPAVIPEPDLQYSGSTLMTRAYGEYQVKLGAKHTVYTGIHSLLFALNGQHVAEPRFSYKYQVLPGHHFSIGYGLHSQIQPKLVYFVETESLNKSERMRTNRDLKMTQAQHLIGAYEWLPNHLFRVKVESYIQHLWNVPVKKSFGEFSMLNYGDSFGGANEDSLINKGLGENKAWN
jgi:hypothetical protein